MLNCSQALVCNVLPPQVHYNVGKNLADSGNATAAIGYYREAVRYFYWQVEVISHLLQCLGGVCNINYIIFGLSGYTLPTSTP